MRGFWDAFPARDLTPREIAAGLPIVPKPTLRASHAYEDPDADREAPIDWFLLELPHAASLIARATRTEDGERGVWERKQHFQVRDNDREEIDHIRAELFPNRSWKTIAVTRPESVGEPTRAYRDPDGGILLVDLDRGDARDFPTHPNARHEMVGAEYSLAIEAEWDSKTYDLDSVDIVGGVSVPEPGEAVGDLVISGIEFEEYIGGEFVTHVGLVGARDTVMEATIDGDIDRRHEPGKQAILHNQGGYDGAKLELEL